MANPAHSLSFTELGRKALHKNYKLTTADASQVCDGRNWESFRAADNETDIISSYRPMRASRSSTKLKDLKKEKKSSLNSDAFEGQSAQSCGLEQSPSRKADEQVNREQHQRRHSLQVGPTGATTIPPNSNDTRRKSLGDDESGDPAKSKSRMTVRKLSEPMHRCGTTNKTVKSALRAARYSSNNLAGMNTSSSGDFRAKHRTSFNGMKTPLSGLASEVNLNVDVTSSLISKPLGHDFFSLKRSHRCDSSPNLSSMGGLDEMGNANWVASGVDFSKSMEVYVFQK